MSYILIMYYSRHGNNEKMAQQIARGVEQVPDIEARMRTVPKVSPVTEATEKPVPASGTPYVTHEDLKGCSGLIMGSPGYYANMAAPLRYFWETTANLWMAGALIGKPAGVFCTTGSIHGGQETTLLSMMFPLIHHGMVIIGLPYSEEALIKTTSGGTPYGASHVSGAGDDHPLTDDEKQLARALGKRVANYAIKLGV